MLQVGSLLDEGIFVRCEWLVGTFQLLLAPSDQGDELWFDFSKRAALQIFGKAKVLVPDEVNWRWSGIYDWFHSEPTRWVLR